MVAPKGVSKSVSVRGTMLRQLTTEDRLVQMEADVAWLCESIRQGSQGAHGLEHRLAHVEKQIRDLMTMVAHLTQMTADVSEHLPRSESAVANLSEELGDLRACMATLIGLVSKLADDRAAA